MPKLILPQENGSSNSEGMSVGAVAGAVSSGAEIGRIQRTEGAAATASADRIGEVQMNFGSWMANYGNHRLKGAMNNIEDAIYNLISSNAAKDYNKQAQDYTASQQIKPTDQVLDDYRKMNEAKQYGKFAQDLDGISKKVVDKYAPAIENPVKRKKFTEEMGTLNHGHKTAAMAAQEKQQIDLSSKALNDAIKSDIQNGILDIPENVGYWSHISLDRISSALEGGAISPEQAGKLSEEVRKGLYVGSLQSLNKTDPNSLDQILSIKSSEELNITPLEHNQLKKENMAALADQDNLNKIQYKAEQEIKNAQSQFHMSNIQAGIADGSVGIADIYSMYQQGKLSFPQFEKLSERYITGQKAINKDFNNRANVSAAISSGDMLSEFSNKQIDDHYQNIVKGLSQDGNYGSVPLEKKVEVASAYQGPVDSLSKEIEYGVKSGNPEKVKNAVVAFEKLNSNNKLALSSITKDTKLTSYISALGSMYKVTNDFSPEMIQKTYDSIYKVDAKTRKHRQEEFYGNSDFSDTGIKSTIAEMYPGGDGYFTAEDYVPDTVVNMVKPLYEKAYMESGDAQVAKQTVLKQTENLIGHSGVNRVSRWGADPGTIMAVPPEFITGLPPEKLRSALNQELAGKIPEGLTADQILIGSDDLTLDQAKRGQHPSYYLYYLDSNGDEQLLPQRWSVDGDTKQIIKNSDIMKAQEKVSPEAKVPLESAVPEQNQVIKKSLATVKGADKTALGNELIDKIASTALVGQISRNYPGNEQAQQVVQTAINSMVGKAPEPFRVGQSLKLINSVLLNNAPPKEFLKFGTPTSTPSIGNIVVTKSGSGLFAGMVQAGNDPVVAIMSMKGKNLGLTYVPLSQISGFRSLPSPENFFRQSRSVSTPSKEPPLFSTNIYTGEKAGRMSTDKDKPWDIYNNTQQTNEDEPVDPTSKYSISNRPSKRKKK